MKICSDLRAAVRSAEKTQPARNSSSWQVKRIADERAVTKLLENPKIKRKIDQQTTRITNAMAVLADADKVIESFGLSRRHGNSGIVIELGDNERFVKAGGDLAPEPAVAWRFDAVMARLANAETEEAGRLILKEYGINWV